MAIKNEDLQAIDERFDAVDAKFAENDAQHAAMSNQIGRMEITLDTVHMSVMRIENILIAKIAAALDGYALLAEQNKVRDERIEDFCM